MGRSIDEDELVEEIKSLKIVLDGKDIFPTAAKDTVLRIISEQPTAYDPDKVVEQLEKSIQISESARAEAIAGMCGASANYYGGAECAYERAIELVRGGGVDGN